MNTDAYNAAFIKVRYVTRVVTNINWQPDLLSQKNKNYELHVMLPEKTCETNFLNMLKTTEILFYVKMWGPPMVFIIF